MFTIIHFQVLICLVVCSYALYSPISLAQQYDIHRDRPESLPSSYVVNMDDRTYQAVVNECQVSTRRVSRTNTHILEMYDDTAVKRCLLKYGVTMNVLEPELKISAVLRSPENGTVRATVKALCILDSCRATTNALDDICM